MTTETQTTEYASPEERLAELPGNWRYAVGTPEERAVFHQIIAELLAEEISGLGNGALASLKISQLIEAVAGHRCKVWLDDVRQILRRVPDAEAIVGKSNEEKLEAAKAKAETAHAKAVEELEAAKRGVIVAETKVKTATTDLERYREAENLLSDPRPGHAVAGIAHLRRLQGKG